MLPKSLVLLFHAIGTAEETGYKDAISPERFERALAWLSSAYRVVPLDALYRAAAEPGGTEGLAALTFDDNHRSIPEIALPLAAARGLPATWFVISGPLNGRPYWRRLLTATIARGAEPAFRAYLEGAAPDIAHQLRPGKLYKDSKDPARVSSAAMAAHLRAFAEGEGADPDFASPGEIAACALPGLTLGNHSRDHLVMAGLDETLQGREIAEAAEALSSLPQAKSRLFAIPFGGPGSYDAATLGAVRAAGLIGPVVTATGLVDADDCGMHPLLAAGQGLVRSLPGALPAFV